MNPSDDPQKEDPQEPQIVYADAPEESQSNSSYIKYNELHYNTDALTPEDQQKFNGRVVVIQCFICDKPLGAESRDLGYITCHDHRGCSKCDGKLQAPEIKWCYENNFPLTHARCIVTSLHKEQLGLELMNLCTKLIQPDPILTPEGNQRSADITTMQAFHEQTHEESYLMMKRAQAIAAGLSFLLNKDRSKIEKDLGDKARKEFKEVTEIRDGKTVKKEPKVKEAKSPKEELTPEERFIKKFMKDTGGMFTREQAAKVYADSLASRESQKSA